jgi:DNA-binding NarL/FixJ family response regulator
MIRVLIVADSGEVMASVTASLCGLDSVDIVGYASGRNPVARLAAAADADLVLVDEMCWPGLALTRIAEVREASPRSVVVGLTGSDTAGWVIDGLNAGASAVVPRRLAPETLSTVLQSALDTQLAPQINGRAA